MSSSPTEKGPRESIRLEGMSNTNRMGYTKLTHRPYTIYKVIVDMSVDYSYWTFVICHLDAEPGQLFG